MSQTTYLNLVLLDLSGINKQITGTHASLSILVIILFINHLSQDHCVSRSILTRHQSSHVNHISRPTQGEPGVNGEVIEHTYHTSISTIKTRARQTNTGNPSSVSETKTRHGNIQKRRSIHHREWLLACKGELLGEILGRELLRKLLFWVLDGV